MNWSKLQNFTESEFTCRCGCGRVEMNGHFMNRLQRMRTACGFPFIVTSGFRCPDYNDQISTTGRNGPHTTGHAADLLVYGGRAYKVQMWAFKVGMTGIGLNQKGPAEKRFVHVDDLLKPPHPRPWVWTY